MATRSACHRSSIRSRAFPSTSSARTSASISCRWRTSGVRSRDRTPRRSRCACRMSRQRRRSSRRRASSSTSRIRRSTAVSATWRSSRTRTATSSCSTGGTRRMSRSDALAAYQALPLPDTTEEHWRFTDLRGFDPESFEGAASAEIETLLDLDVAGYATVTADGIEIEKAPEGITFAPLPEEHERLYSLVGWDEKFAAHNAALWQHGLLVVVPKGVELEKPLYVRISTTGQPFWRLVVVVEEGARASLIEEYASPADDTEAYSNAVTELFVEPAAKLEYVSLQNLSRETWHFATH